MVEYIGVKMLNQPGQQPEETRRKQAIRKTYQYERVPFGEALELPGFRAELINRTIAYEQILLKTGIGRTSFQNLTEACETGMWTGQDLRIRERFKRVFGFDDDAFRLKIYEFNELTAMLEELEV